VQRDEFALHNEPTPRPGDDASAWNEADGSFDPRGLGRPRMLPSVRLLAVTAALGVVLALVWRYGGIQSGQFWPASPAQPAQSAGNPKAEEQFAQLAQDLDALKKSISELTTTQQQLNASIAALQASQQELRQRASAAQSYWYSEPALRFRVVAQQKPAASPPRTATARADARERAGQRRAGTGPLQLVAPRP